MSKNEELRRLMQAASNTMEGVSLDHLSDETLIAFYESRLSQASEEKVRSHLAQCEDCAVTYQMVFRFFEPSGTSEEPVSQVQINRAWETFRRHSPARAPRPVTEGPWSGRRLVTALAAGLVLAVAAAGVWTLKLREENRQLTTRSQQEARDWAARFQQNEARMEGLTAEKNAGAERVRQQEQVMADLQKTAQQLQRQLEELKKPRGAPVYEVSAQLASRGPEPTAAPQPSEIFVQGAEGKVILMLFAGNHPPYARYIIRIFDRKNQGIGELKTATKISGGYFPVLINPASLPEGPYRFELYGGDAGQNRKVAEWMIDFKRKP